MGIKQETVDFLAQKIEALTREVSRRAESNADHRQGINNLKGLIVDNDRMIGHLRAELLEAISLRDMLGRNDG